MFRAPTRLSYFVLTVLAATAAGAAERDPDGAPADDSDGESKSYTWGLGVGAATQQQAYAGIDRENMAVPLIFFENRWVELFGPWLDFKLPSLKWENEQELAFAVRVHLLGFDGYEPGDAPILNGMAERKSGFLAGPSIEWSNPYVNVSAEWLFDASSESDGQQASLSFGHSFGVGQHLMFTPGVTATWLDKKAADYYYGVRDVEARSGRPAYIADSTVNVAFSLRTDYMFDQHQSVFAMLGYTALGTEIKDSPLTDRNDETLAFMGYLYRF